jgi:hypothetical protein
MDSYPPVTDIRYTIKLDTVCFHSRDEASQENISSHTYDNQHDADEMFFDTILRCMSESTCKQICFSEYQKDTRTHVRKVVVSKNDVDEWWIRFETYNPYIAMNNEDYGDPFKD